MSCRTSIASRVLLLTSFAASGPSGAQALPHLVVIDTSGSQTPHFGLPDAPLDTPVTQLRLRFDTALLAVPVSAFRLIEAGADGAFGTLACGLLPVADDIDIGLTAVQWDATLREATLQLDPTRGLPRGNYRVLACDTLQSLAGLALDGDDDGLPGGIAHREFTVQETPALDNPGFDESIAGWSASNWINSAAAAHAPLADADDALHSGALRASADLPIPFLELAHAGCVDLYPLAGWRDSSWRLSLRHRVVTGSVRVTAEFWYGFSGDMGEPDCRGPGITDEVFFDAQAAPQFATYDSGWRALEPMPLAQLRLRVSSRDNQPFEILFDDIGLRFDSRVIFRDDFD